MSCYIFEQLDTTAQTLRENLHRNALDPTPHKHMQRTLSHVRETYIATNEIGRARSVAQLAGDLEKVNHLVATGTRCEQPVPSTTKPICI